MMTACSQTAGIRNTRMMWADTLSDCGFLSECFRDLVREKPVWHLIGRLSELIGGTGYHRVRLIDAAIDHFGDWWLKGAKSCTL